ncbi:hypothetical protein DSF28_19090 [Salmonella enterica subsp. enterica serovar Enteritidis]|nr:hypothetical protein [Salmonella enterica subsp. enterica serovar Enteritidis]EBX4938682.1 hypothetical protein [Salmonella enterica subsp. enterica serovar Enteritidis]EBY4635204.1 hypothetical protein [Salmonella enterica subsp. enterica serovar Enteritidis]ECA6382785.1 hypothetical protein [Salmonella enterica subsp. enterica serovar Enteritidis]
MSDVKIYTATPADLSPPVQSESFCVDMVLASDYRELEAKCAALRDDMRQVRKQLADAGRLIADLDKHLIEYAGIATREARRAAELEARTVNLPAACADDEYFIDGVFQALRYERDIERAVIAAGIKVI